MPLVLYNILLTYIYFYQKINRILYKNLFKFRFLNKLIDTMNLKIYMIKFKQMNHTYHLLY